MPASLMKDFIVTIFLADLSELSIFSDDIEHYYLTHAYSYSISKNKLVSSL